MDVGEFQRRVERMEARGYNRATIAEQMERVLSRRWYIGETGDYGNGSKPCLVAPSGAKMESFATRTEADAALIEKQAKSDADTAELVERWLVQFCDLLPR